jgi:hypothetical protein
MTAILSYSNLRRSVTSLPVRIRILLGLAFVVLFGFVSLPRSTTPVPTGPREIKYINNVTPSNQRQGDTPGSQASFADRPEAKAAALAGAGIDPDRAAEGLKQIGAGVAKHSVEQQHEKPAMNRPQAVKEKTLASSPNKEKSTTREATTKSSSSTSSSSSSSSRTSTATRLGLGPSDAHQSIPAVIPIGMAATIPATKLPIATSGPAADLATKGITLEPNSPWPSFAHIFSFGDSWSYTAFDIGGTQPSKANPFGNPELPQNGVSHPPEWLYYLTTTYNASLLKTYNIAHGAATVDRDAVAPHEAFSFTATFKEQALDLWRLVYKPRPLSARWRAEDTLFTVWFGVVDISMAFDRQQYSEDLLNSRVIAAYVKTLTALYSDGARNFLLLNVPPLDLAPGAPDGIGEKMALRNAVASFNERLKDVKEAFLAQNEDVSVALFDTRALLSSLMKEPKSMRQTERLGNTTQNCWDYNPVCLTLLMF